MSDLDRLIADIDALVDWQMTESPAAKVEHDEPGSMDVWEWRYERWMRRSGGGPWRPSPIRVWVPYVRTNDGAGVLREDDPPGRAL